jgi:archaellum biogenesis ATPase FlaH
MNKVIISIITVFLLLGCVKERYIGQYVSTTIPVIEFIDNSGAGSLSLISNKGNKNTGFDITCSLNKISNNTYNIHANVTPTFNMDRYLQVTFHLILLNSGQIVRNILVPATVHVGRTNIIINKDFENDVQFDSFTFFYEMKYSY